MERPFSSRWGCRLMLPVSITASSTFKVATRRTYTTLFGKETSFIVNMEYLTSTFYLTIAYGKFIAKYLIQFIKEQVTGSPCTFCIE